MVTHVVRCLIALGGMFVAGFSHAQSYEEVGLTSVLRLSADARSTDDQVTRQLAANNALRAYLRTQPPLTVLRNNGRPVKISYLDGGTEGAVVDNILFSESVALLPGTLKTPEQVGGMGSRSREVITAGGCRSTAITEPVYEYVPGGTVTVGGSVSETPGGWVLAGYVTRYSCV